MPAGGPLDVTGRVRPALAGFEPYDPAFTPCRINLSANENTRPLPASVTEAMRAAAVSGGRSSSRGGGMTQTNTFHIQSNDRQAVAREVERVLRRYESDQHALLSD